MRLACLLCTNNSMLKFRCVNLGAFVLLLSQSSMTDGQLRPWKNPVHLVIMSGQCLNAEWVQLYCLGLEEERRNALCDIHKTAVRDLHTCFMCFHFPLTQMLNYFASNFNYFPNIQVLYLSFPVNYPMKTCNTFEKT